MPPARGSREPRDECGRDDDARRDPQGRQHPGAGLGRCLSGPLGPRTVSDSQVASDSGALKSGDIVGQSGIEKVYNTLLMGDDGAKRVVVNSVGREIRVLDEEMPVEGKRLQLTIDYDLQRALEDVFRVSGFSGASVVLDPRDGAVLAFTSLPGYDPNAFAAGIDRATWASLNTDTLRPLQNRAIQGRYSPGSTFKMAVALAALEEGVITPDFKVSLEMPSPAASLSPYLKPLRVGVQQSFPAHVPAAGAVTWRRRPVASYTQSV